MDAAMEAILSCPPHPSLPRREKIIRPRHSERSKDSALVCFQGDQFGCVAALTLGKLQTPCFAQGTTERTNMTARAVVAPAKAGAQQAKARFPLARE